MTDYTAIMYKIIPAQLDWLLSTFAGLDSPAPDGGSHLNSHAILFETPPLPLLYLSRAPIRNFRFQALLQPPSPTMSHYRRTY